MRKTHVFSCLIVILTLLFCTASADSSVRVDYSDQNYNYAEYVCEPTESTSPIQCFTEGWNISFGESEQYHVILKTSPNFTDNTRTYIVPLSKGYKGLPAPTAILNANSIEDAIVKQIGNSSAAYKYWRQLMTKQIDGQVRFDAHIQLYSYDNGKYKAKGKWADTKAQALALADWSHKDMFDDYYDLYFDVQQEPKLPDELQAPIKDGHWKENGQKSIKIKVGESVTLIDDSYPQEDGATITKWNVEIVKLEDDEKETVIMSKRWITNPVQFFKKYTFPKGRYKLRLFEVIDSNGTSSNGN